MANLNARNQQILGLLGLINGPATSALKSLGAGALGKDPREGFKKISDEARASVRQYGIEKPSLTYVGFTVPNIFTRSLPGAKDLYEKVVKMRAERVNQPGVQIMTSNVRRYGVGPTEKKPFTAGFNDINVSFIGDSQGVIHQFFYAWMNGVVRFDDMPSGDSNLDKFNKMPFEVEYRVDYRTTIDIIMYDEVQKKIGTVTLYNAYPIAVGEIQRDWAGINDLVRVNVGFTYSHWAYTSEILGLKTPTREVPASKFSMFGSILTGMNALQAISAVKRPQNVNDVLNVVNTGSTLLKSFLPRTIDY